jgi:hypothetical protein
MSLSSPIIAVLAHFEPLFTASTWKKVMTLLVLTLLARGRRTVTAALRQMGQEMAESRSVLSPSHAFLTQIHHTSTCFSSTFAISMKHIVSNFTFNHEEFLIAVRREDASFLYDM